MVDDFVNIENIKVTRDEIAQRIIDYYKSAFDENKNQITDFNDGSNARNLIEAISTPLYELRYLIDHLLRMAYPQRAMQGWLDEIGVLVNCYRDSATKSKGFITISTNIPKNYDITIPVDTVIQTEGLNTVEVQTTEQAVLQAGSTSINVAAEAVNEGIEGNVMEGTLTQFADPISDLTATNNNPFTGGTDAESDEHYRTRILQAGKGSDAGKESWFKSIVEDVNGVHDAKTISNPLNEDFNIKILVNGYEKPAPDVVINAVTEKLNSDEYKVAGLKVTVTRPNYVLSNVTATITLKTGYSWDAVKTDLLHNIKCYYDGGITTYGAEYEGTNIQTEYIGLNINEDIVRTQIMLIIANTPGILDYNLETPSGNVNMGVEDVAQLGEITLTRA